jgi:hypothetical protein
MAELDDENSLAQSQALERLRVKRDAYLKLFGPPGARTPLGQVVLDDLDRFCKRGQESIHLDATGRLDPYTTIYRDGKKAVADRIHLMIEWSDDEHSSRNIDSEQ